MNEDGDGVWPFALGEPELAVLQRVVAVGDSMIGLGRLERREVRGRHEARLRWDEDGQRQKRDRDGETR
jgi:hypothetical protein